VIYLFSQISISLLLAAIVGGVLGWLAHRARAVKQIKQLQSIVTRQQQQVSQAQTDVAMLTEDFDDLKLKSEAEISHLKQDNQKIPALNQNLEKSQLLVRQLLQKHEAEVRELSIENEKLVANGRLLEERDKSVTKLQTELEIAKRRNRQLTGEQDGEEQSELDLDEQQPVSAVSVTELPGTDSGANDFEQSTVAVRNENGTVAELKPSDTDESNRTPSAAETEAELRALRDQLADDEPSSLKDKRKPAKKVSHKLSEPTVDENSLEPMFDPVEQHDDLKQIFGIG